MEFSGYWAYAVGMFQEFFNFNCETLLELSLGELWKATPAGDTGLHLFAFECMTTWAGAGRVGRGVRMEAHTSASTAGGRPHRRGVCM